MENFQQEYLSKY